MTAAIRLGDVVNFFECEKIREDRRRRVIALKERRRGEVGPYLSFVFENRETLLFQIQEMCRAERIIDDAKIQEEIDKPVLDRFMGIDTGRHVWFEVGAGLTVPGSFEAGHSDEEKGKMAAVHFVRFAVSREAARRSATPRSIWWWTTRRRARARLSDEAKAELLTDLTP